MLTNPLNDRVQPTQTIGALNRLTVVLGHGYYELIQLENKAEIKAKFLDVFGEPMTKDSFQRVDWARILGYRLPDGSDDE